MNKTKMDKSSKNLLVAVFLVLVIIIGSCFGGIYYVVKLAREYYSDENLKIIYEKTSEEEGFCLTNLVKEYSLTYANIPQLFKEACVSIVVDTDTVDSLGSGVCIASKGYQTESGTIINSGSYISTNYHVIQDVYDSTNSAIYVYPNDYTNTERYGATVPYEAELLWSDKYLDMALIYVKENIDWVKMMDRTIYTSMPLREGENVFAIGSPQSLEYQNTITKGSIADSNLQFCYTEEELFGKVVLSNVYEDMIAMQVAIMGGNSGGGLFDSKGYLIGQPTLGAQNSQNSNTINYSNAIYGITIVVDDIIDANEKIFSDDVKIYSLDDLNFKVIDKQESYIITQFYKGNYKYFYDNTYLANDLVFENEGLKVIDSTNESIKKGDIIISVEFNDERFDIFTRNDLIYILLDCEEGDVLKLNMNDETYVELMFA